jgi:hypothetical protein
VRVLPLCTLSPDHAAYWFLMQIEMILGFITVYPVNVWLIRRGIKEPTQCGRSSDES